MERKREKRKGERERERGMKTNCKINSPFER